MHQDPLLRDEEDSEFPRLLHLSMMTNQILGHGLNAFKYQRLLAWCCESLLKCINSTADRDSRSDAHTLPTGPLDRDIMPNVHANVGRP